jgi:hypothetical protein
MTTTDSQAAGVSAAPAWGGLIPILALAALSLAAARDSCAADPPFAFHPLGVANGCHVESVACFDAYRESAGAEGWARVLQWGARQEEVMVAGHAVAVFDVAGVPRWP